MIAIVVALVAGSVLSYYWPTLNTPANPPPTQATACVRPVGYILIIADLRGFNDSVDHLQKYPNEPWPVISVHRGDQVNIYVCDLDDYSPHGFAIQHYFDAGTALMPHQTFSISFIADQDGNFTIYCTIFCPVHPYMISGQLQVTG